MRALLLVLVAGVIFAGFAGPTVRAEPPTDAIHHRKNKKKTPKVVRRADVLRWLLERKFSLELLRQFSELRSAIEPAAAALAAKAANAARLVPVADFR